MGNIPAGRRGGPRLPGERRPDPGASAGGAPVACQERESARHGARARKSVSGVRLFLHLPTGDPTPRTGSGPGPAGRRPVHRREQTLKRVGTALGWLRILAPESQARRVLGFCGDHVSLRRARAPWDSSRRRTPTGRSRFPNPGPACVPASPRAPPPSRLRSEPPVPSRPEGMAPPLRPRLRPQVRV